MDCLLRWGLRDRGRFVHSIAEEGGNLDLANAWIESYDTRIENAERADTIISGSSIPLPRYPDAAPVEPPIVDRILECN